MTDAYGKVSAALDGWISANNLPVKCMWVADARDTALYAALAARKFGMDSTVAVCGTRDASPISVVKQLDRLGVRRVTIDIDGIASTLSDCIENCTVDVKRADRSFISAAMGVTALASVARCLCAPVLTDPLACRYVPKSFAPLDGLTQMDVCDLRMFLGAC